MDAALWKTFLQAKDGGIGQAEYETTNDASLREGFVQLPAESIRALERRKEGRFDSRSGRQECGFWTPSFLGRHS
ncbi:uncharacterized protein AKAW2_11159A [Aspergillus luchuensis]|uniref:Uncharacterized protein n=1 Tax=Aspergillus kawachii TaxID=1069201 RepID=A0A7R7ZTK1_ASPKA|nr:uncharacterized protein AKAW2_11159A [Aspergillus luchuensis]BCR94113.1 hypothetical protein AKAW2_11159A [Aspergillus luchuensis]